MRLGVQVEEPFASLVDEELVQRVIKEALTTLGLAQEVELGVLITNDETVQGLNRQYRGVDETTDVLAFALREAAGDFPLPPGALPQLGEVIISCPQAQRQAEEAGHSLEVELSQLLVHGLLHLLGYGHEEAQEEEQMRSWEGVIWQRLFS